MCKKKIYNIFFVVEESKYIEIIISKKKINQKCQNDIQSLHYKIKIEKIGCILRFLFFRQRRVHQSSFKQNLLIYWFQ